MKFHDILDKFDNDVDYTDKSMLHVHSVHTCIEHNQKYHYLYVQYDHIMNK